MAEMTAIMLLLVILLFMIVIMAILAVIENNYDTEHSDENHCFDTGNIINS